MEEKDTKAGESAKQMSMKSFLIIGVVALALGLVLCLPTMLASLSGNGATQSEDSASLGKGLEIAAIDTEDLSGGVAADVGDVQIGENAVTAYINNFRYAQGLQDDEKWGQWVFDAGYSMNGLRAETVDLFVNREIIRQAAASEGITVTDEEVDQRIAEARGEATDEQYAEALEQQGLDEASYRENVRIGILQERLAGAVAPSEDIDEKTLLEYVKMYYPDMVSEDADTLEGVDEEIVSSVREMLSQYNSAQGFSNWVEDYESNIDVVTHIMPEGLPYVVDLRPYEEAAYQAEAEAAATAETAGSGGLDKSGDSSGASAGAPVSEGAALDTTASEGGE